MLCYSCWGQIKQICLNQQGTICDLTLLKDTEHLWFPQHQQQKRGSLISLTTSQRVTRTWHGFSLLRCSVLLLVSDSLSGVRTGKNKPLFRHGGKFSDHTNPVYIHSLYSLMAAIFPAGSVSLKKEQSSRLSASLLGMLPSDRAVRVLLFQSVHILRTSTRPWLKTLMKAAIRQKNNPNTLIALNLIRQRFDFRDLCQALSVGNQ